MASTITSTCPPRRAREIFVNPGSFPKIRDRIRAAAPSGTNDMEQFFSLKQEANQIDNELERHEDELERQYRNGSLTRDEFRTNERELDHLEDLLDAAEDQIEYVFGIDD